MGLMKRLFNRTRKPEDLLGKTMLSGMNPGHAKLADWGFARLPKLMYATSGKFESIRLETSLQFRRHEALHGARAGGRAQGGGIRGGRVRPSPVQAVAHGPGK